VLLRCFVYTAVLQATVACGPGALVGVLPDPLKGGLELRCLPLSLCHGPQHFLNLRPLPQGQGWLRPTE